MTDQGKVGNEGPFEFDWDGLRRTVLVATFMNGDMTEWHCATTEDLQRAGFVPKAELEHAKKCLQEEYESRCRACLRAEALERQVEALRSAITHHLGQCNERCPACGGPGPHFDIASCIGWNNINGSKPTPEPGEPVDWKGPALPKGAGRPVPAETAGESRILPDANPTLRYCNKHPWAAQATEADPEPRCPSCGGFSRGERLHEVEQLQSALTRAEGRVRELEERMDVVLHAGPSTGLAVGIFDRAKRLEADLAELDAAIFKTRGQSRQEFIARAQKLALRAQPPLASSVVADDGGKVNFWDAARESGVPAVGTRWSVQADRTLLLTVTKRDGDAISISYDHGTGGVVTHKRFFECFRPHREPLASSVVADEATTGEGKDFSPSPGAVPAAAADCVTIVSNGDGAGLTGEEGKAERVEPPQRLSRTDPFWALDSAHRHLRDLRNYSPADSSLSLAIWALRDAVGYLLERCPDAVDTRALRLAHESARLAAETVKR